MKTPSEIEFRTLQFLESARLPGRTTPVPGAPTACFPAWPGPPLAAARRLAAHANAARGQDMLWLVGVRGGRAIQTEASGLEAWLAGISRFFDGLTPRVTAFNVPAGADVRGQPLKVVALKIETGRAPFVIRIPGRRPSFEVPWIDGSEGAPRPAGRTELIKLLAPLQELPHLEVLDAELTFYHNSHGGGQ